MAGCKGFEPLEVVSAPLAIISRVLSTAQPTSRIKGLHSRHNLYLGNVFQKKPASRGLFLVRRSHCSTRLAIAQWFLRRKWNANEFSGVSEFET